MPSTNVMHEFKEGSLHSGSKSGPKVKSRKQAVAIMLSEREKEMPSSSYNRIEALKKIRNKHK